MQKFVQFFFFYVNFKLSVLKLNGTEKCKSLNLTIFFFYKKKIKAKYVFCANGKKWKCIQTKTVVDTMSRIDRATITKKNIHVKEFLKKNEKLK